MHNSLAKLNHKQTFDQFHIISTQLTMPKRRKKAFTRCKAGTGNNTSKKRVKVDVSKNPTGKTNNNKLPMEEVSNLVASSPHESDNSPLSHGPPPPVVQASTARINSTDCVEDDCVCYNKQTNDNDDNE